MESASKIWRYTVDIIREMHASMVHTSLSAGETCSAVFSTRLAGPDTRPARTVRSPTRSTRSAEAPPAAQAAKIGRLLPRTHLLRACRLSFLPPSLAIIVVSCEFKGHRLPTTIYSGPVPRL